MFQKLADKFQKVFKKKPFWIFFVFSFLILVLFRNSFFGFVLEFSLSKKYPDIKINFSKFTFVDASFKFEDFEVQSPHVDIEAKEVSIGLKLDFMHFQIAPKVKIIEPLVFSKEGIIPISKGEIRQTTTKKQQDWVVKLLTHRIFFQIEEGFWNHADQKRCHFSVLSHFQHPEIKKISLSFIESLSLDSKLDVTIRPLYHEYFVNLELRDFDAHWLSENQHLVFPAEGSGINDVNGKISGIANFRLNRKFEIMKSDLQFEVDHLKLETTQLESLEIDQSIIRLQLENKPYQKSKKTNLSYSGSLVLNNLNLSLDHYTAITASGKIGINLPIGSEVDFKGQIKIGKDAANFLLKGKDSNQEEKNQEFIVDFLCTDENLSQSKANFVFYYPEEDHLNIKAKVNQIPSSYLSALQKTLDYYFPELSLFKLEQGSLSLEALAQFKDYKPYSIDLGKIELNEMKIFLLQPEIFCQIDHLQARIDYNLPNKKLNNWFLNAQGISIALENEQYGVIALDDTSIKLIQEDEKFSLSTIEGLLFNQPIKLEFSGPISSPDWNLKMKLPSEELVKKFKLKTLPTQENFYWISFMNQYSGNKWDLSLDVHDESGRFLKAAGSMGTYNLSKLTSPQEIENFLKGLEKIKIQGNNLHSEIYGVVLKFLKLPWDLQGDIDISGVFDQGVLNLNLAFDKIDFDSNELYFQQEKKIEGQKAFQGSLMFDCVHEKLKLLVDLDHGICLHKECKLWFEDVIGSLEISDNLLKISKLSLNTEHLNLKGDLSLEFLEDKPFKLMIDVSDVRGRMINLQRMARHFPEFQHLNLPFDGDLYPLEEPFQLQMILYPQPLLPDWKLNARVKNGEFYDLSLLKVVDVEFELCLDSKKPHMEILDLEAHVDVNSHRLPYKLTSSKLLLEMQNHLKADFNFALEGELLEIARLEGVFEANGENIKFDLRPNALIKDWQSFHKEKDLWKRGAMICHLNKLQIENIVRRLSLLHSSSSFIFKEIIKDIDKVEGIDLSLLVTEDSQLKFDISSRDSNQEEFIRLEMLWNDQFFEIKKANLKNLKSNCLVEFSDRSMKMNQMSLTLNDYELTFKEGEYDFLGLTGRIGLDNFKAQSIKGLVQYFPFLDQNLDGEVKIYGDLILDKDNVQVEVKQIEIQNCKQISAIEIAKPFFIQVSSDKQIVINQLDLRLTGEANHDYFFLKSEAIKLDTLNKSIESDSIKLTVAPEMIKTIPSFLSQDLAWTFNEQVDDIKKWDNLLQIDLAIKAGSEGVAFKGKIEDGYYWINDRSYFFENIWLTFEKNQINMEGLVNISDYKIAFETSLDIKERSNLVLELHNLLSPNEKAKMIFAIKDQSLDLINFYGTFFGTKFDLLPKKLPCVNTESVFTASLELDMKDVLPFLPKDLKAQLSQIKLEEKIFLKGNLLLDFADLKNSYFKGFITSKNMELQDMVIQNVQALLTYDQSILKIENFSVADSAVLMKFDQMVIDFGPESFLDFVLKNFQVNDFRPSLITKVNQPKGKIKPFLVRNLKIEEVKGNLKNADEIKGKGNLQFINTFKRENHLIDIPIEIIARLGLDIGLLIPVRGEIDIEIKDKKVWLKELKNSFSDGKRSHFYFPSGKPCYIDFDGNVNIDVKMKQYVLFKLTQPFTLSLRGTLDKPSFSLK